MATHPRGAVGETAKLRRELLAAGAEVMYRRLTKQLDALRRAYPAVTRFDQDTQEHGNGHGELPAGAGDALQMFRARKQTPAQQAARSKNLARARAAQARQRKAADAAGVRVLPRRTPKVKAKAGLAGTLKQNIIETLRDAGPLTSMALASALYDKGWRSPTATTDQKRIGTIGTMLAMLRSKEKTVEPVSDDESPKRWQVA